MNNTPFIIRETANGMGQLSQETRLFEDRCLYLTEEVTRDNCTELIKSLMILDREAPGTPITLYINSPGGSVTDGLGLYDTIRILKSPVNTVCLGLAASMGAVLFLAGEERLMLPHAKVMIHDASYGGGDFAGLKPAEIQKKTDDLMETCKVLRKIVAERTGQDRDFFSGQIGQGI